MTLSGAGRRAKGARAEREVITLLKAHGWKDAERTSNGRVQQGHGDVRNGPQGCHIEIKRQEKLSVPAALAQIERDRADALDIPVLIHRPSGHGWMATLPLDELLALLRMRETA